MKRIITYTIILLFLSIGLFADGIKVTYSLPSDCTSCTGVKIERINKAGQALKNRGEDKREWLISNLITTSFTDNTVNNLGKYEYRVYTYYKNTDPNRLKSYYPSDKVLAKDVTGGVVQMGDTGSDRGNDIKTDQATGDIYVAGSKGGYAYLSKYDKDGKVEFAKTYKKGRISKIVVGSDGVYALSIINDICTNIGGSLFSCMNHPYLEKYNKISGKREWSIKQSNTVKHVYFGNTIHVYTYDIKVKKVKTAFSYDNIYVLKGGLNPYNHPLGVQGKYIPH